MFVVRGIVFDFTSHWCSSKTGGAFQFPVNPLADNETPISSLLLRDDYSFNTVIRPTGSSMASWTQVAGDGFAESMSTIVADVGILGDGTYDVGIQVTCQGETFISDVIKGSIDRKVPEVKSTFPRNGGSVDSPHDIHIIFDEPLECGLTFVTMSVSGEQAVEVQFVCKGASIQILPTATQVQLVIITAGFASIKCLIFYL